MRFPCGTIAGAGMLLMLVHAGAPAAEAARLCIVPVPFRDPDNPYFPRFATHFLMTRTFPGSPWPVIQQSNAPGPASWTLNERGQLQRADDFPHSLEDFVVEPSGRVIGFWWAREQLYIQDAATGRFAGLAEADEKTIGRVATAAWISSRRATLVGTSKGIFTLAGDGPSPTLKPLTLTGASGIEKIGRIFDLPLSNAAAVATYDGRVFVLASDDRLHEVPGIQVSVNSWLMRINEVGGPNRLLIERSDQTWTAPLRGKDTEAIPGAARKISRVVPDGSSLNYYPAVGQYPVYGTPDRWFSYGPALQRLDDDLTAVKDSSGLYDHPFLRDISSRGIVVVQTFSRLYTYDGKGRMKPIPGSTEAEIGQYPWVHDLAGQNKVVVVTINGLYELAPEGRLVRLPLPPELAGAKFHELAEMPASHLAVVFTDRGIFGFDAAGTFSRVTGDRGIDFGGIGPELVMHIPVRETLFVSTHHSGQFIILDENKAGPGACLGAQ
jgi:hypothetical protein